MMRMRSLLVVRGGTGDEGPPRHAAVASLVPHVTSQMTSMDECAF